MKLPLMIGLLMVGTVHAGDGEPPTLGEVIETITKLEASGKWTEALPIYRKLHGRLRHAIDGLSTKFMLRKGICELQCREFGDAEKSFEWITSLNGKEKIPDYEILDRASAMFYLAETQALEGKPEASERSLAAANRFFDSIDEFRRDATMQRWRTHRVARIRAGK